MRPPQPRTQPHYPKSLDERASHHYASPDLPSIPAPCYNEFAMDTRHRISLLAALLAGLAPAASVITARLDDPKAVYLSAPEFGARGDGQADDTAALQAAIDKAENRLREGILFIPPGR